MPKDLPAIHMIHQRAFEQPMEALLVDALRRNGKALISLVAEVSGTLVGHILFSPVTIDGAQKGVGLAPVAVSPKFQNRGVGKKLVLSGIAACRTNGHPYVVVLGHPEYYTKFGFTQASTHGIGNEYGVDKEFMILELTPGTLPTKGGTARYAEEFGATDATAPEDR